ncbi:unnamed protein product [Symbiodinium necroappetens]|uniref:Uncharacterized protein n=1 Tax=Symbiodinium necroappetens TaxID=1628268 RepID=A0A813AYU5_9DINO|nr:unnamed protein product [Symbiodinium necroappetens]
MPVRPLPGFQRWLFAAFAVTCGVAFRHDRIGGAVSSNCDLHDGCECWQQKVCSSCTLSRCGIDHVLSVRPLQGGTNRLRPDLAAAYGLEDSLGRHWALKLADQENGSYDRSVLASQLAHTLKVPTPRVLQVSMASCPAVFQHKDLQEVVAEFQRQKRHWALLQEFVSENQDLQCAANLEPFWVQVGQIAMFDWITGRNDLFNDLLVGGETALADNMEVNKDNIKTTPSQAVEIDLGFSEPCCLDDFVEILSQLGQRRVAWVPSHILVLMCEGRNGGLGSQMCSSAFGDYSALRPKGWHPEISRIQIERGLAQVATAVLNLTGSQAWSYPVSATLTLLQEKWSKNGAQAVVDRLRTEEEAATEVIPTDQKCCSVACQYRSRFWTWHHCGEKAMKTVMIEDACNIRLSAISMMLHCSPVCGGATKVWGTVKESKGSCPAG